jgi:hypothetical protein
MVAHAALLIEGNMSFLGSLAPRVQQVRPDCVADVGDLKAQLRAEIMDGRWRRRRRKIPNNESIDLLASKRLSKQQ